MYVVTDPEEEPGGFLEQALLPYLNRGTDPEVAIEQVAVQLSTGELDEDQSLRDKIRDSWEALVARAEFLSQHISVGNRTFRLVG